MYNYHGGCMKKKIAVLVTSIIIIIIFIIGIIFILNKQNNKILTSNKFIIEMKKQNFQIYDAKEQFGDDIVKEATVAYTENYQIEFLVFDNIDNCKNAFQINKSSFITNKKEEDIEISESNNSYSLYSLTTKDRYMYIKRIDNRLLYFNVDGSYKDNLDKLLKKIGL